MPATTPPGKRDTSDTASPPRIDRIFGGPVARKGWSQEFVGCSCSVSITEPAAKVFVALRVDFAVGSNDRIQWTTDGYQKGLLRTQFVAN
jgi:hypothetical protein